MESGLMAFWSDIGADYLQRFQQWHNCEHIPERVSLPGFRRGCRYRAMDNRPHFLMYYETDRPEVLGYGSYLSALNSPTPWTKEALGYFKNPVRCIYRLTVLAGAEGPFAAPWVTSLRFNSDAPSKDWVKSLARARDVLRTRLYSVDEAISGIMTSERKIYGGGPGDQQYLLLIEEALPGAADAALDVEMPACRDLFRDSYWLEMSHRKKEGVA